MFTDKNPGLSTKLATLLVHGCEYFNWWR